MLKTTLMNNHRAFSLNEWPKYLDISAAATELIQEAPSQVDSNLSKHSFIPPYRPSYFGIIAISILRMTQHQ